MKQDLTAIYAIITRPKHQADTLISVIEQLGGSVLRYPTIDIKPLTLQIKPINWANWQYALFTSVNAVNAIKSIWPHSNTLQTLAIGPATADAIEKFLGNKQPIMAQSPFNSQALLTQIDQQPSLPISCLIFTGKNYNPLLSQSLTERGITVNVIEAYQRECPKQPSLTNNQLWQNHRITSIIVTSQEGLINLHQMTEPSCFQLMTKQCLLVPTEKIEQKARALGFNHIVRSENPSDSAIIKALKQFANETER